MSLARMPAGPLARKTGTVVALFTLASLLALSCDECTSPRDCRPEGLGIVQGFVLGGGAPVVSAVELLPLEPEQEENEFSTRSDSTGWYSLTVPVGRYFLRLGFGGYYYSRDGLADDRSSMDTLVVSGQPQRIDLVGSAVRLRVDVPPVLRDREITAGMKIRNGSPLGVGWRSSRSDSGLVREFHLPLILPGPHFMLLDFDSGPVLWLPPTLDPENAGTFEVGESTTATFTLTLPEPAWISGEITGSWQQLSYDRPTVMMFDADSTLLHEERFFSTPRYRFILPLPEAVRLAVVMSDRTQWIGGDDFSSATVYAPGPGEEISGASLVESGITCLLEGPGPLVSHSAELQLCKADGAPVARTRGTHESVFSISNLQPGTYYLYIQNTTWDQPWYSQWYDGADSLATATPITIAVPGEVVAITAHLREGGQISGRVTRAGSPAAGVWISLRKTDGSVSESHATRTTTGEGTFAVCGLGDGDYWVGARNTSETGTYWYPGTYDPAQATAIHIENHNAVADVEWQIPF